MPHCLLVLNTSYANCIHGNEDPRIPTGNGLSSSSHLRTSTVTRPPPQPISPTLLSSVTFGCSSKEGMERTRTGAGRRNHQDGEQRWRAAEARGTKNHNANRTANPLDKRLFTVFQSYCRCHGGTMLMLLNADDTRILTVLASLLYRAANVAGLWCGWQTTVETAPKLVHD